MADIPIEFLITQAADGDYVLPANRTELSFTREYYIGKRKVIGKCVCVPGSCEFSLAKGITKEFLITRLQRLGKITSVLEKFQEFWATE